MVSVKGYHLFVIAKKKKQKKNATVLSLSLFYYIIICQNVKKIGKIRNENHLIVQF